MSELPVQDSGALSSTGGPFGSPVGLAVCDLFRGLVPDRLADLESRCRCLANRPGDIIVSPSAAVPHGVYVVLAGWVEVVIVNPNGDDVMLAQLGPGAHFGEFAAIDGRPGSVTVRARTATVLAEIPPEVFRLLLRDEPAVALRLMERLVRLVRSLDVRVALLQDSHDQARMLHRELVLATL